MYTLARGHSGLSCIPRKLDVASMMKLLQLVDKLNICSGHPEPKFVTFVDHKKGKLHNRTGKVAAFIDSYAPVHLHGEIFEKTVRTSEYEMLVHGDKSKPCSAYRQTLCVLQDRWSNCSSDELSSSSHLLVTLTIAISKKCQIC